MNTLVVGFADELVKVAASPAVGLVERLVGAPGSPLRKAVLRGAALGAGTTAAQNMISNDSKHPLRSIAGGALAGAITGRSFPGWFNRAARTATE